MSCEGCKTHQGGILLLQVSVCATCAARSSCLGVSACTWVPHRCFFLAVFPTCKENASSTGSSFRLISAVTLELPAACQHTKSFAANRKLGLKCHFSSARDPAAERSQASRESRLQRSHALDSKSYQHQTLP